MKKLLQWTIGIAVMLILAVAVAANWLWQDVQTALDQPIMLGGPSVLFEIERGSSLAGIARQMNESGWIKNDLYLRVEARRLKIGANLKAGLYEVYDGSTPRELLRRFVQGDIKVFQITFIEGARFADMRTILAQNKRLRQTIVDKDEAWILTKVDPSLTHAEGYFFPSTYNFSSGDSDLEILQRAHQRMQELLAFYWSSRAADLPYESPVEPLIMASIIEKETGRADERAQIAGVFLRRLRLGMKLQTDPTIIYGLGDRFDGNLRRIDLETDTEYNTYTRHGLPPTPIAMPGEDSIRAALNPATGKFLYFVGKGDGSHAFSKSLDEHNAAVHRFQLSTRAQR